MAYPWRLHSHLEGGTPASGSAVGTGPGARAATPTAAAQPEREGAGGPAGSSHPLPRPQSSARTGSRASVNGQSKCFGVSSALGANYSAKMTERSVRYHRKFSGSAIKPVSGFANGQYPFRVQVRPPFPRSRLRPGALEEGRQVVPRPAAKHRRRGGTEPARPVRRCPPPRPPGPLRLVPWAWGGEAGVPGEGPGLPAALTSQPAAPLFSFFSSP